MKKSNAIVAALVLVVGAAGVAFSHCEIPCGIYDDKARVLTIREHLVTIEKSMRQIDEIGAAEKPNWNQLVRWVSNKEHHADEIQEIVTRYFMTQRVKVPADEEEGARARYHEQLASLHQLLVTAMRTKQTTDPEQVKQARALLDRFVAAYFGK